MELEEMLDPQERILCRARMHPAAYAIPAIASFFCFAFLCAAFTQSGTNQLVLLLISAGFLLGSVFVFFFSVLQHAAAELLVTNRRLLSCRGIFKTSMAELDLQDIESSELVQGGLGRQLGYATLQFRGGALTIAHAFVRSPKAIQESLELAKGALGPAEQADVRPSSRSGAPRAA